jgi:hypothetical protein
LKALQVSLERRDFAAVRSGGFAQRGKLAFELSTSDACDFTLQ